MTRLRIFALGFFATLALSGCSGAYLIDSSEQGGEAFIGFTIMVLIFAFGLFYMDRVREKRMQRDDDEDREPSRK